VINTTGCGDALLAGVVTAMQRRYDFESICRLACACGLSCAMHAGTANIDPGQIEALQKKVDIVSV
jgi:tagatose 6-phosphate kinase